MTDLATGLYAHGAIMASLLQRHKTGLGQKINCDLLSTQVLNLGGFLLYYRGRLTLSFSRFFVILKFFVCL